MEAGMFEALTSSERDILQRKLLDAGDQLAQERQRTEWERQADAAGIEIYGLRGDLLETTLTDPFPADEEERLAAEDAAMIAAQDKILAAHEARNWTIAYRKPHANHFHRVTDWAGTWQQAFDLAGVVARAHPELQVWYAGTRQAELDGYVVPEDHQNILTDSGRRVPVTETGTINIISPEQQHVRRAEVKGKRLSEVEAYLPSNYHATQVFRVGQVDEAVVEIVGYDRAGWTLDDYVIPRLASGLIFAHEA
jgi:hypothetical protein